MKYFLIAGEASGDLHASNLMKSLKQADPQAEFRCYGGDKMQAAGGTLLCHYSSIAYMGFIPVVMHARTILRAMKRCRQAIVDWQPDVLVLVDYPGFNLKIAKFVKANTNIPVHYYISPKIWAWKEHRIKNIRRDVDQLYSILPFEVPFFTVKHHYPVNYVGNPSVDEIALWKSKYTDTRADFLEKHGLPDKPIVALLPGSRRQEITDNLRRMVTAALPCIERGYQLVIAAAPDIEDAFYRDNIARVAGSDANAVFTLRNSTFEILSHAEAALVTSGTATLETALFGVPQTVCYYIRMGKLFALLRKLFLKVKYISLVNLIVDRELVPELVGDQMNVGNLRHHLQATLKGGSERDAQIEGYAEMTAKLGEPGAPARAAALMVESLRSTTSHD
jgi:lipid-A-disaccharide synthase